MNEKINVELLKALRAKRSITQEELAIIAGVSLRTIQRLEKSGTCSLDVKRAIAAALDIEAFELSQKPESSAVEAENTEQFMFRVENGARLAEIISGAHAYRITHEQPESESESEVDILAESAQSFQEWGEIWSDLEVGERVKATYELNTSIKELEAAGFWVFGAKTVEEYPGIKNVKLDIANIRLIREANPQIITVKG